MQSLQTTTIELLADTAMDNVGAATILVPERTPEAPSSALRNRSLIGSPHNPKLHDLTGSFLVGMPGSRDRPKS